MTTSEMSLFDVESVEESPMVRDMIVAPVTTGDVVEFTGRYHYAKTVSPYAMSWRWGLWHGAVLQGVVAYNLPTISTCSAVFGPEHRDKVWHMSRLALADNAPRNSESRLIGQSLRVIQREHDVWAVITYADTQAGHIGTVYQATNAIYTGTSVIKSFYTDSEGIRRTVYQDGKTMSPEVAASRGWQLHRGMPKHRYVYILGSKTQRRQRLQLLKLPVLPYPKHTEEGRTA